ncbi:unnamed protein product [Closterium sp. NIES-65]|nr:unnamed protein product [Closterium sp. NIES-65]
MFRNGSLGLPGFGGDDEEYNTLKQKLASPSQKSVRLPPSSSGSAASSASNRDVPAAGAAASAKKADVQKTDVPLESARTAANVSPAIITVPIVRPDIFSDAAATPSATAAAPDPSPDASSATGSISRKASNESRTNESVQAGSSGADETGSKEGSLHARQAGTSKRVAFALPSLETGEPAKEFTKAVRGLLMAMAVISTAGNRSARSGCYRPCDSQVSQGGREGGREGAGEGAGVGTGAGAGEEAGEGGGGRGSGGGSGVAYALWTHHYERLKVAVRAAVRIEQLMSRAMPEAETAFWASVLLSKAWPLFLNASHTPHSSLPPFLVTLQAMPEAETAFWASVLLSKAWPLFLNDLVSTKLMPKVAPWFLSRYKPPMLVRPSASTFPPDAGCSPMLLHPSMSAKVEVVKANFGDTAPVITSIKAFREGGGRNHVKLEASVEEAAACANNKTVLPAPTPLVASPLQSHLTLSMTRSWRRVLRQHECASSRELEASVELVGADNLSVQATAYVAGMGSIPWTAYITGLQLTGTMRVGLRFRRSLPFVDRVTLSFVRPPQVSCAIKVMGALDAGSIPLVASYVVRACHGVGWESCFAYVCYSCCPSHPMAFPIPPGNEQEYTLQNALKTSLCWYVPVVPLLLTPMTVSSDQTVPYHVTYPMHQ